MEIEFSLHAKEQIREREIKAGEVINAIKNPGKVDFEYGKYYAKKEIGRSIIEVVYKKDGD